MLGKIRTSAMLVVLGTLAVCSTAQAAVGTGAAAEAKCYTGNRILVTAPKLQPEFPAGSGGYLGNGWVTNNPSQDVAYRAHIYRWNGYSWAHQARGPWYRQTVTSNPNGLGGTAWINTSTGLAEQGGTQFNIFSRGSFRVAAEYHWYPVLGTSYTGGSLPVSWLAHFDYRTNAYSLSSQRWCDY